MVGFSGHRLRVQFAKIKKQPDGPRWRDVVGLPQGFSHATPDAQFLADLPSEGGGVAFTLFHFSARELPISGQ